MAQVEPAYSRPAIDVADRFFATERRSFILADTPGHVRYTRNMFTGASTADLALVLVDARHGLLEQSRRHTYLAALLGIRHLAACVNKMDLVDFSQVRFREVEAAFGALGSELGVADVRAEARSLRRMEQRELGDSGLSVSTVALGSWLTYSGGIGREQTEACTRAAFDAGITLFDTANVYGTGAAERAWGEILRDYPRDSYVLATKVFFPMGPRDRGLSRAQILKQIDGSLKRLQTDFVDLYQCHRYDSAVPLEETLGALTEVVEAGKARFIGFSEWPADKIQAALSLPGVAKFVSSQPQYSALHRAPEAEVIPLCEANGISQIVWSPLAQGVLTGKYTPGAKVPADSRAASKSMNRFIKQWLNDETLTAVQALRPIADGAGVKLSQLALAWVLHQRNVSAVIVGATRPEQVHENAAAADVRLSEDVLAAIDGALKRAVVS